MTGYGFFRFLRFGMVVGLMPLVGVLCLSALIYEEVKTEIAFHQHYGPEWREQYESAHGSLNKARTRMVIMATGIVAIGALTVWIARLLQPNTSAGSHRHSHRRRHRHRQSPTERWAVCRRKALVGIYFGGFAIVLAGVLTIFRVGIFAQHTNEVSLGILVFLVGYLGIIVGSSYWLKAKAWNEGIVVIALLPFGIFLIPFVRILFIQMLVSNPAILPMMMVIMAAMLVVVVAALPDRSGVTNRKRSWDLSRAPSSRSQTDLDPETTAPGE